MIYNKWYLGQSKSKYDTNGFDNLVNCDVHSEPGALKCQLALILDSATPNEACIQATAANGDTFFASTASGKIWKRTAAGTYSLVHTNGQGSNVGIRFFNSNLYYATTAKLGKITEAFASSEASWSEEDDSFGTFTNSGAYKPMYELNLSLFIGDGKYLASVDSAGDFSANSLDIYADQIITTITGVGTDLLIGTIMGANKSYSKVFLWDTISASWTIEDDVPEIGVNCFIPTDNITFAQCGTAGWIYYWTGAKMEKFKQIRSVTTGVNHYASTKLSGKALYGVATKVFSLHRADKDFPYSIVQEYTATTGTIGSLGTSGANLLVPNGTNVNKIGTSYATAVITTPETEEKIQNCIVKYDAVGGTGAITIGTNIDNAGSYTAQTPIVNAIKKEVSFDGGLGTVNFIQGRVTLTPQTTHQISIKSIELK